MQDASHYHLIVVGEVENSVALVDDTAYPRAIIGPRLAQQRKIFELGQDLVYLTLVGFCQFVTKPFRAERSYIDQIEPRIVGKPNLSHAARGARR